MIRSMYQGITALDAFKEALSVTSNNIANSQTTGYKSQRANFEDLLYQTMRPGVQSEGGNAGINPVQIGNGVKLSSISTNFNHGTVNGTGRKTDAAIEGKGYFILGNEEAGDLVYSRDGTFDLSDDNRLVSQGGQYVMGWNANENGDINTNTPLSPLNIRLGEAVLGRETTEGRMIGNLDGRKENGEVFQTQFTSYDSGGNPKEVTLNFLKGANNQYQYITQPEADWSDSQSVESFFLNINNTTASFEPGEYTLRTEPLSTDPTQATVSLLDPSGNTVVSQTINNVSQNITLTDGTTEYGNLEFNQSNSLEETSFVIGGSGTVDFSPEGEFVQSTPFGGTGGAMLDISYPSDETGGVVNYSVDISQMTSYATSSSMKMEYMDGEASATLNDFTISDNGYVQGYYSDGTLRNVGQIGLASFTNEEGLERIGQNNYRETAVSGAAEHMASGEGSVGTIRGTSLEMSNVDLATEFVDLMSYEKAFQGSTRIISISDNVLSGIINLIQ